MSVDVVSFWLALVKPQTATPPNCAAAWATAVPRSARPGPSPVRDGPLRAVRPRHHVPRRDRRTWDEPETYADETW